MRKIIVNIYVPLVLLDTCHRTGSLSQHAQAPASSQCPDTNESSHSSCSARAMLPSPALLMNSLKHILIYITNFLN